MTVDTAQEYLVRPDKLNGFLFAVVEGEDLNATIGHNADRVTNSDSTSYSAS